MSNVSTVVRGHESLKEKYKARVLNVGHVNHDTMNTIVLLVEGNAKKLIRNKTSSGKKTRYNPKRVVTVSAEGKAPNSDLGNLIKSITHDVKSVGKGKVLGTIRSRAPYSLDLEFGTIHMEKRPFMEPALKGSKKQILAIVAKGVRSAL